MAKKYFLTLLFLSAIFHISANFTLLKDISEDSDEIDSISVVNETRGFRHE